MHIEVKHEKNPAMGWDIVVEVTADEAQAIATVTVRVNGFVVTDEAVEEGMKSWRRLFSAQGQYPGENQVVVEVLDSEGNRSAGEDTWA